MAILNVTPDSFHDGGMLTDPGAALDAARQAADAGADILDIGGESTRPGAGRVSAREQLRRVLPLIEAIRREPGPLGRIPVSIDTTLAEVARAALDAGADAINDVSGAMEDPDMLALAGARGAGLVLMHRLLPPEQDSYSDRYEKPPVYDDVVRVVRAFLRDRASAAQSAGVASASIVLDPGLGFGKTVEQNLEIIRRTRELASLGFPILSGLSRKSFTGRAAGLVESDPGRRLSPTLALSALHLAAGASIFRVHDVPEHVEALRAAEAALGPARRRPESPGI